MDDELDPDEVLPPGIESEPLEMEQPEEVEVSAIGVAPDGVVQFDEISSEDEKRTGSSGQKTSNRIPK
jgi:hypothetical protein